MRMHRRDVFRQFGAAIAASALFPPRTASVKLAADSSARLVRLKSNESAYGPCEKAKSAFHEAVTEANRFPAEDVGNLRDALAVLHGVQPEHITLGCGSREIFCMAAQTWLGPGKSLVMASPTFDLIADTARRLGAEVRNTPLTRFYAHDLDAMLARTDPTTQLVYVCNPNNPTGTLTPRVDLEALLRKLSPGIMLLIDEAYHDYVAPTGAYASWATHAAGDPRLIVTRTFSKVYGLAGLRIGYAVSSAETAKRLTARRVPTDVNVVAARVALAALSDLDYVQKIAAITANDRQEFFNQANARMVRWLDSQANFALLAVGKPGKQVEEMLRARGVLVSSGFPSLEKHIRVSLGLPDEMKSFWRAWDDAMPHHPM